MSGYGTGYDGGNPDGSEPRTAADEDDFNDIDQFDSGVSANISVATHGDGAIAAPWIWFAKKAFYMAHDYESIADVVPQKYSINPEANVRIEYSVQPGPYGANVRIDIHSDLAPPPEVVPEKPWLPAIGRRPPIGGSQQGGCQVYFGAPGARLFTQAHDHLVDDGSSKVFETTEAALDDLGDWGACAAEFDQSAFCGTGGEDRLARHVLDLPFDFTYAGNTYNRVWISGHEIGFSGPKMAGNRGTYDEGTGNDDMQYRVSVYGIGHYDCNTDWKYKVFGTHGRVTSIGSDGGLSNSGALIMDGAEYLELHDFGQVPQESAHDGRSPDLLEVALHSIPEDIISAAGIPGYTVTAGAASREFFAITVQEFAGCPNVWPLFPDGILWGELPILESEIVLFPATEECSAAVGIYLSGGDGRKIDTALVNEGVIGGEVDSLRAEDAMVLLTGAMIGDRSEPLYGNEWLAWAPCDASIADTGTDKITETLEGRTFWFDLDSDGFPNGGIAQIPKQIAEKDNYNVEYPGDMQWDNPSSGKGEA